MMRAKSNWLSRAFSKGPDGQFSMLFAISAPIMALYVSGAMDYVSLSMRDEPLQAVVPIAAPAAMAEAVKGAAALTDTPTVALAARYFDADPPTLAGANEVAAAY